MLDSSVEVSMELWSVNSPRTSPITRRRQSSLLSNISIKAAVLDNNMSVQQPDDVIINSFRALVLIKYRGGGKHHHNPVSSPFHDTQNMEGGSLSSLLRSLIFIIFFFLKLKITCHRFIWQLVLNISFGRQFETVISILSFMSWRKFTIE